jgi:YesN/AraC family two-component response regulator
MTLFIKNMVCDRCKTAVHRELQRLTVEPSEINLGEVKLVQSLSSEQLERFSKAIKLLGFELIEDKTARLISKIKSAAIEFIHYTNQKSRPNFSAYLIEKLHKDYSSLSHLFSEVEGITLEHFLILQKVEHAKELLVYDELSMQEIADQLGYSSAPHLSNQFKKITGLTPSHFKKIRSVKRNSLDNV